MNLLEDNSNLFLFMWLGFGALMFEILALKYILLCYLTDNIWWGNSFNWFGNVLHFVGL